MSINFNRSLWLTSDLEIKIAVSNRLISTSGPTQLHLQFTDASIDLLRTDDECRILRTSNLPQHTIDRVAGIFREGLTNQDIVVRGLNFQSFGGQVTTSIGSAVLLDNASLVVNRGTQSMDVEVPIEEERGPVNNESDVESEQSDVDEQREGWGGVIPAWVMEMLGYEVERAELAARLNVSQSAQRPSQQIPRSEDTESAPSQAPQTSRGSSAGERHTPGSTRVKGGAILMRFPPPARPGFGSGTISKTTASLAEITHEVKQCLQMSSFQTLEVEYFPPQGDRQFVVISQGTITSHNLPDNQLETIRRLI